jgi:hypothetical protein
MAQSTIRWKIENIKGMWKVFSITSRNHIEFKNFVGESKTLTGAEAIQNQAIKAMNS